MIERKTVVSVEEIGNFDDEYVYDIGVASNNPYFFANDILVHNSCYFSAYEVLKDNPDFSDFEWSRENIIQLYDSITDEVNASFPSFMNLSFNTGLKRGAFISGGRELVGSKGLFIRKKKYSILMYDKEGTRFDVDGCPGKLKNMGIDTKRSDVSALLQKFLGKLLLEVLTDVPLNNIFQEIRDFRNEFTTRPGWEKGRPMAVKALTIVAEREEAIKKKGFFGKHEKKVNVAGHVRAALNWNLLCDVNHDNYSTKIGDGNKVVVCKLLPNSLGMTSVAYPVDQPHLPYWFKELPFDHSAMERVTIDSKLENMFGVLGWDMSETYEKNSDLDDLFVFE